jgi:hypothetical protein
MGKAEHLLDYAPVAGLIALVVLAVLLIRAGGKAPPHDKGNIRGGGPGDGREWGD